MSSPQIHSQTHSDSSIDLGPPTPSFSNTGDEILPPYTNHLRLASLCRRKREFQAAFDKTPRGRRTWELVWLVLDGTALRVYRPKSLEKKAVENTELGGGGGLGLGLGLVRTGTVSGGSTRLPSTPVSNVTPSAARSPLARILEGRRGRNALLDQPIASGVTAPPLVSASEPQLRLTRSRDAQGLVDSSAPSSFEGQARRHRRMDSIAKVAPAPAAPPAYSSHPVAAASYSVSTPFLTPAQAAGFEHPATATTTTRPAVPISTPAPDFSRRKACRQYHLQHAICMRADAYTKREHVLRFILEDGKQFIIQLSSRAETISWLQLMSIAAPLSLDLDERPMPEPAHYPRRRPRQRARAQRRPSTAPGALGSSTPVTATQAQDARGSPSATPTPPVPDTLTGFGLGERGEGEGEGEEGDDDGEESGDPLIVEEDMDHLPPPRRPVLPRSLSSVEQARRRGIQL